jgi:hypothetical protein
MAISCELGKPNFLRGFSSFSMASATITGVVVKVSKSVVFIINSVNLTAILIAVINALICNRQRSNF